MEFAIGGAAAVTAGIFTNPLEVLKIRMQLQGELKSKGQHAVYYRNAFHALYVVIKNDGILALQNGLVAASWVQLIMNGMRFGNFYLFSLYILFRSVSFYFQLFIGTYDFFGSRGWLYDTQGELVFYRSVLISGTGGVLGHLLANPFFITKTHLQAQAVESIAVGYQHHHQSLTDAFKTIYKKEGVLKRKTE